MGAYNKYQMTLVTADAAIKDDVGHIWAVLITSQSGDSDIVFHDHASSASGDKLMQLSCLNSTTEFADFTSLGGIPASTGIYADITGTGAQVYVWWD